MNNASDGALEPRKATVLRAVVDGYTETDTPVPVGSRVIASQMSNGEGWSPATIRNDLATLVHVGYLMQPHASAGRVPSDRGYRYYVDFLMDDEPLSLQVRKMMEAMTTSLGTRPDEALEGGASMLAATTQELGLVTGPREGALRVKFVVHDGVRNLLRQPDFSDFSQLEQIVRIVEEGEMLSELLGTIDPDADVHVMIGSETGVDELRDCSLVFASYDAGHGRYGTVGVLGPSRMRYGRIAPRVKYAADLMSKTLERAEQA